jgi:hypothetical protein
MNLIRRLALSTFLVMSILHPVVKFGTGSISLHGTFAEAGEKMGPGSSGGGGDYLQDAKPTPQQVMIAIDEARRTVPFVLNHLESVITDARAIGSSQFFQAKTTAETAIPLETYQKMFPWPEKKDDAQARWQRLTFKIEPAKPCYDEAGMEKAASAVPLNSDTLCLSIPKIRESAVQANLVQRLTALLVHELSHKMGVSDHRVLEQSILSRLPVHSRQALEGPINELRESVSDSEGGLRASVDTSLELLNRHADWSTVCYNLAGIASATKEFARPNVLEGGFLTILRPAFEAERQAIFLRSQIFRSYCEKESQGNLLNQMFKNQNSKPVNLGGTGVLSIARGILRRPVFHDSTILKAELTDIQSALVNLHSEAQKVQQSFK